MSTRYESTLKHADTEEWIDLLFYRPVGYRVALFAERWGVTPNAITVAGIFLGLGCALLCYPADCKLNLLAIVLLVMADVCDSADGQLARLTGQYSRLGRILDGAAGDIWFIAIYVALCLRLTPDWGAWIWVVAALDGIGHRQQAALADYYRIFHLFVAKGKAGSELSDSATVSTEYAAIRFSEEPVYKVFMFFYRNYTLGQEKMTPALQQLRSRLRQRFADRPIDAAVAGRILQWSRPLMPLTNFLSFNSRAILLFLSMMVGLPWLFFVGQIVVWNAVCLYMVRTHERQCRRECQQL